MALGHGADHASGHSSARERHHFVLLYGPSAHLLRPRLRPGLLGLHGLDVVHPAAYRVPAAQASAGAGPSALLPGGDLCMPRRLVGARRGKPSAGCARGHGIRVHHVCTLEPFSAVDKDPEVWRQLALGFPVYGGPADLAAVLCGLRCIPSRAFLECAGPELGVLVSLSSANPRAEHWPASPGMLHLVISAGLGGADPDH
mmetsp:Transcript_14594/g.34720  ORF Transcript_14594/g.34720 Transcript_14594/m.34720 type:complete len:200 (+) Transcript_14594:545-1144(+)